MTKRRRRVSGAVVWRVADGGIEVLLVHRLGHDDWALPKGGAKPAESDEQCAIREVQEETGLRCTLDWELAGASYLDGKGVRRAVRYWAARPLSGTFIPNREVDETCWLRPAEALCRLTEPRERPMVVAVAYAAARGSRLADAALGRGSRPTDAARPTRVILLRRASVLPRQQWSGSDDDRPLREEGLAEAEALCALAPLFDIEAVLSSPARRCVQTLTPLAGALGRPVQILDALAGRDPAVALAAVREVQGRGVVLCSHESVIRGVLERLVAQDGLQIHDRIRRRRASAWCLEFDDTRCLGAMYLPSPETIGDLADAEWITQNAS